jgi:hypothetical protein
MHNHPGPISRAPALLIAFIQLICMLRPACAQADTRVRFSPAELQVPLNGTAQVAVEVTDVQGLYGVDIAFTFDPAVVDVVGATPKAKPGATPGKFLDEGFVALNKVDNTAGTGRFVMTQLNPSKPKNGTGVLLVLTLRGKREGATSPLALTRADMAHSDGTVFSGIPVPGRVNVAPNAQATPTTAPVATRATPALPQNGSSNTDAQASVPLPEYGLGIVLAAAFITASLVVVRRRTWRQ